MKHKNHIWVISSALALLLFAGCGGTTSVPKEEDKSDTTYTNPNDTYGSDSESAEGSPITSEEDEDSDDAEEAVAGTEPTYLYRVGATGHEGTDSVTVSASKRLKIRFTPGVQDEKVAGTGYSPTYSKLGLYVVVGDQVQSTTMLSNGAMDEAESSAILDFSTAISEFSCSGSSAGSSGDCARKVTIQVERPSYDFNCLNFGVYCPHSTVNAVHPWNGTLEIETDDTMELSE